MIAQDNQLLLSSKELIGKYAIPEGTIRSGKHEHLSGSPTWRFLEIEGEIYFYYDCLPTLTKKKLPTKEQLLADLKTEEYNGVVNKFIERLRYHKANCFIEHYNYINKRYMLPKETARKFAELWAVWAWILQQRVKASRQFIIAYNEAIPGHLGNEYSFCNFRKKCQTNGIEANVIDGRATRKYESQIPAFQLGLLQSLYIQPQKITTREAHTKLMAACKEIGEKAYSLASVKLYFKQFENNVELYAARYGEGKAQKQLSYASLLPAQHRNTQWQCDGWTLGFWGEKFQRYVLYMVRDNHSRKILGYCAGKSENTELILSALDDAMRYTGVFPGEIVSDKHSFHKTDAATRLKAETEKMGAVWTVTMNAQRNQLAERYNQYLDALCKDYTGYLGKNMTATGKDARPSPEALAQMARTANFKTEAEIKAIAASIVLKFNKEPLDVLEGVSPNKKYDASENLKAFVISEAERVALLRPVLSYKVVRGQINIKVGMRKHEFQLPAALIARYNNKKVQVTYEDLSQGIYLGDLETGEELGCIAPKRKIHGAIPDQNAQDRKLLNKETGRKNGTTSKARKTAQERIAAGLSANPEAIALINHYSLPKDVRTEATQNNELKRQLDEDGVNVNMIPQRQVTAYELPGAASKKTRKSPFIPNEAATGNYRSLEDLLGMTEQEKSQW